MATNNRPKVELQPGEEVRITLTKDEPVIGKSQFGPYTLYDCVTEDGTEMVFFGTPEVDQVIKDHKLGKGSHFILRKTQENGRKPKLEIALISKDPAVPDDNLKAILLQSIRDAVEVVKETGMQFSNDEIQKLATTIFIQRVRQ